MVPRWTTFLFFAAAALGQLSAVERLLAADPARAQARGPKLLARRKRRDCSMKTVVRDVVHPRETAILPSWIATIGPGCVKR